LDETLSKTITFAVAIVLTFAAVAVVLFGASQSRELANTATDRFDAVIAGDAYDTTFDADEYDGRSLPMLAIAEIVRRHSTVIDTFSCDICGKTATDQTKGDCIYSHPQGRGMLAITEIDGEYNVRLEAPD
jgi:hypothetical protein